MTFHGKGILVSPGYTAARSNVVGLDPHRHIFECAPQSIVQHRIEHLLRSELPAFASAGQQKRSPAHAFHAAGDDQSSIAGANRLISQHHGLEARTANLVDRQRGDSRRQTGVECRVPSRRLAQSGCQHAAHDHLVDRFRSKSSPADCFTDDDGSKFRRRHRREPTEEPSDRRSASRDEKGMSHSSYPVS